jgi:hypothetical protein
MHALFLAVAIAIAPPPSTQAERLASYIVHTYHASESYADELAERIVWESSHYGLDPSLLTAICHLESWFSLMARGTSGERGLWQIYPDRTWRRMKPIDQRYWTWHIVISTWRAATIVAHWARRYGHSADAYCHYNSGYAPCRRGYVHKLRVRSEAIRRVLMMHGRPR